MRKAIAVIIAFMLIALFTGCEFHSGLRIGYVGNSERDFWRASYKKLDGRMTDTLRTEDDTLLINIETESGSISIKVYDTEKNLIYEANDAGEYELTTDGKIRVVIDADDHRGSFNIRTAE